MGHRRPLLGGRTVGRAAAASTRRPASISASPPRARYSCIVTQLRRAWKGHVRLLGVLAAAALVFATFLAVSATTRGDAASTRPETVARGSFTGLVHPTVGSAKIVELGNGDRRLVMAGFETRAAPELFVYLVPGSSYGDRMGGAVQLGRLKYIEGGQTYDIPSSFHATESDTVIIWCGRCSNAFGRAQLRSL